MSHQNKNVIKSDLVTKRDRGLYSLLNSIRLYFFQNNFNFNSNKSKTRIVKLKNFNVFSGNANVNADK